MEEYLIFIINLILPAAPWRWRRFRFQKKWQLGIFPGEVKAGTA